MGHEDTLTDVLDQVLDAALDHDPWDPRIRVELARRALARGDEGSAVEHLRACLDPERIPPSAIDLPEPLVARALEGWTERCRTSMLIVEEVGADDAVARWPEEAQRPLEGVYEGLLAHRGRVRAALFDDPDEVASTLCEVDTLRSPFDLDEGLDRNFGHIGRVVGFLLEAAPWLSPARYLVRDQTSELYEIWLVDGVGSLLRHRRPGDEWLEALAPVLDEVGEDPALRELIAGGWRAQAWRLLDAWSPAAEVEVRQAIERAGSLGARTRVVEARLAVLVGDPLATEALRLALVEAPSWRDGWLLLAQRQRTIGAFEEAAAAARRARAPELVEEALRGLRTREEARHHEPFEATPLDDLDPEPSWARGNLATYTITPPTPLCLDQVTLPTRPGAEEAVERWLGALAEPVEALFSVMAGEVVLEQHTDWQRAGLDALLAALRDLAPMTGDARFLLFEREERTAVLGEVRHGRLRIEVGRTVEDGDALLAWVTERSRERPDDEALTRFLGRLRQRRLRWEWCWRIDDATARAWLDDIARTGTEDPRLYVLRAEHARRSGDRATAERELLRAAELEGRNLLWAALAAEDRGRALEHLVGFRERWPEDVTGRLLHALWTADPGLLPSEAPAAADPWLADLSRSDGFAEGLLWLARVRTEPAMVPWLLAASRRLADPAPMLALLHTLHPDEPDVLSAVGAAATAAKDWGRAADVLWHRAALVTEPERGYAAAAERQRLVTACYHAACEALYGRPAGADRPPGKPSDEALARTEDLIGRALSALEAVPANALHAACWVVLALVAAWRKDHATALRLADDAVTIDPTAHALTTRASVRCSLGDLAGAASDAVAALAKAPDHHHAELVLACVAGKRRKPWAAVRPHVERVVALWPEGRPELAEEPDLARYRREPAFRALVGLDGQGGGGA